jgi:hypothetical protein
MPIGLKGNTDGSGAVQIGGSDAISISTALNTTFAGTVTATGTVAGSTGTLYPLVSGTAVSATGTAIDFTGIPSWVRRITVMFQGVSTNGTSFVRVRIGPVAGVETTGYVGASGILVGTPIQAAFSAGFDISSNNAATTTQQGVLTLALLDGATNTWSASWTIGNGVNSAVGIGAGSKPLTGALSIVRITTVNGTDTFDAGSINILYE